MFSRPPSCLLLALIRATLPFFFCIVSIFAQSAVTGRLSGTVKDQNGAVIVGSEIAATNKTSGERRTGRTGNDGRYTVVLLRPGEYSVEVIANGFKSHGFDHVHVNITETTTLNVELGVAQINADQFTVSLAPLVNSVDAHLGRTVNNRAVVELPLATRN